MATTSSIIGIVVTVVAVHLWAMVLVQQAHSFTLDGIPARCHNPLRIHQEQYQHRRRQRSSFIAAASSSSSSITLSSINSTKQAVEKLKKVLEREYVSFFDPMERSWYATDVSFEDPMTSLSGVDAYQGNVDMLASRDSLLGSILFDDAGIVLHAVTGGEVNENDGSIANIMTRWTLRVTVKVLPWKPTARFTGVSVYEVSPGGTEGVLINHQTDYWDSINIQEGGRYDKVDKITAVKDFLNQLKPDNGNAAAAGVELPYQLLRRGKGYEVRRYPAYTVAKIPYDRRDVGYDVLATITAGVKPLAPALMEVPYDDSAQKTMSWPLGFVAPGSSDLPPVPQSVLDKSKEPMWSDCEISSVDSTVVAVGSFSDASVAPIVRKADRQLREALSRDGISVPASSSSSVKFAQFDAIFSLGKRRGEVWIELDGGHPW